MRGVTRCIMCGTETTGRNLNLPYERLTRHEKYYRDYGRCPHDTGCTWCNQGIEHDERYCTRYEKGESEMAKARAKARTEYFSP